MVEISHHVSHLTSHQHFSIPQSENFPQWRRVQYKIMKNNISTELKKFFRTPSVTFLCSFYKMYEGAAVKGDYFEGEWNFFLGVCSHRWILWPHFLTLCYISKCWHNNPYQAKSPVKVLMTVHYSWYYKVSAPHPFLVFRTQCSRSEKGYIFIPEWKCGKVPESFGHNSELFYIKHKLLGQVLMLMHFPSA